MIQKISPSLLWLAALLCGLFFINDWQLELFASSIILIFIWSIISFSKNRTWQIPSSLILGFMSAFWFLGFLSILGSEIISISLMAFCFFSVLPLSFFVFAFFVSEKDFLFTAKALGVVYAGLSLWALLQFFVFGDYFNGRAHHPLANPNSMAALFSLGFFCAVGWMLGAKDKVQSYIALSLAILLFGGIMAAGSRGVLFSMLPVLALFLFFMRDVAKENLAGLSVLFLCCAGLFFLTSMGFETHENLFNRVIENQSKDLNGFTNNRISLWIATWEMIKEYGIFGTGIGTYFLYFPEFRLSDDPFGAYYAHNDPLQYWVELGVLGPVLFYAFIIAVIGRTVQAIKKAQTAQKKLLVFSPFFALGAMIIHTHVTFNLYNLSILLVTGFLLGVWFYTTQQILKTPLKEITFPKKYSISARVLLISLPFFVIGTMFLAYIGGEHFNNKARDHMLAGELEEFSQDVVMAQTIGLNGNYRPYLLAVNVPLSLLEEADAKLGVEQKEEITKLALGYLQHVRKINPRSSSALFYMGKLKEIGVESVLPKNLKSAAYYYTQALKIDPLHIGSRLALARIFEEEGNTPRALEILERGIGYKYASTNAMELYATLTGYYLENGNAKKRDEMLRRMNGFQKRVDRQEKKNAKTLSQHIWGD